MKIWERKMFQNINEKQKNILDFLQNKYPNEMKKVNVLNHISKVFNFGCEDVEKLIENYITSNNSNKIKHDLQTYLNFYGDKIGLKLYNEYLQTLSNAQLKSYRETNREAKFNHFYEEYWINKGFTEKQAIEKIKEIKQNRKKGIENSSSFKSRNRTSTQIGYWIDKGFTEKQAIEKVKERNNTNSVESIQKRNNCNLEEAIEIRNEITKKWQTTLENKTEEEKKIINLKKIPKNRANVTISNAEKELFKILKCGRQLVLEREDLPTHYVFDLYKRKKIIEYNGDYWHCNPKIYNKDYYNERLGVTAEVIWRKDFYKIQRAKELGYEVLVIWESDYKKDKELVIRKCEEFLYGKMD